MAQQYPTPAPPAAAPAAAAAFPFDALYCSEEEVGLGCFHRQEDFDYEGGIRCSLPQLLEQDLSWEDGELSSLFAKEEGNRLYQKLETNHSLSGAREDAVDWILKVNAHYSFAALTAVLAVNYLDRFLSSFDIQTTEKPWMAQLAAVACLSLAAKVEETQVPVLLDLQVEDSKYLFEAKTIQRMEILVLSTLQWKMNPVTPLSFLDYIARRLGLKDYLCWEFLKRCERIVLSVISDSRSMRYLPSVAATATMLHVVNGVEPCLGTEYQSQLLGILGMSNDEVEECSKLVMELASRDYYYGIYSNKRKFGSMPGSPNAVTDVSFSSDSSNDSWAVASASSSVSSSPEPPLSKKSRAILSLNQEGPSDFLSILPR